MARASPCFGSALEYDGRPAVLGLVLDVSERRQAEAELERYRLQLEDLVPSVPGTWPRRATGRKAPTAPRAPSWAA
jgi:hypothetical protein